MKRVVVVLVLVASASRRLCGAGPAVRQPRCMPNPKYDGQFTFVRLRYGAPSFA